MQDLQALPVGLTTWFHVGPSLIISSGLCSGSHFFLLFLTLNFCLSILLSGFYLPVAVSCSVTPPDSERPSFHHLSASSCQSECFYCQYAGFSAQRPSLTYHLPTPSCFVGCHACFPAKYLSCFIIQEIKTVDTYLLRVRIKVITSCYSAVLCCNSAEPQPVTGTCTKRVTVSLPIEQTVANVPKKPPSDIITTHQGTTTAVQMSLGRYWERRAPVCPCQCSTGRPVEACTPHTWGQTGSQEPGSLEGQTNPKGRHQTPMTLRPSSTGLRFEELDKILYGIQLENHPVQRLSHWLFNPQTVQKKI